MPEIKIGEKTNMISTFLKVADRIPDHVIFIADGGQGSRYTYRQVKNIVLKLATSLMREPYASLKEIGIISENRPEWCMAYLAIVAAGKTVIPIDANYKDSEIGYIINHSNLKMVFTSVRFESTLTDNFDNLIVSSFNEASPNHWLNLTNHDQPFDASPAKYEDVAVLIYTSGTTGAPKAVELSHKNLLSNLESIERRLRFDSNDIFLSVLPLHHTFEATGGFLLPLMAGCQVVYARSLKSNELKEDIRNNNITIMIGVPLLFEKLYHTIIRRINDSSPIKQLLFKTLFKTSHLGWKMNQKWGRKLFKSMRDNGGLGSVNMFVSGGAAMPSHINKFFNLIGFDFLQGYGMTECSPVATANYPGNISFDSVGPAVPGVEVDVFEPNENGIGEIRIKGDNVTPGYRDNPQETAKLIRDGWLYTGDLGRMKNGSLWITGRKKNLIISAAGKNIYPEQIEEKLSESMLIMESVVFGRSKEGKHGEEVCAIIVPDMEQLRVEHNLDPQNPDMTAVNKLIGETVKQANQQMSAFKRISSFEVQLDELEKTSTKKVKRYIYS